MAHFYSRASREARLFNNSPVEFWRHFYSRASREARPACVFDFSLAYLLFLLTRLSRGATASCNVAFPASMISTHAPLARRDNCSHFNKPKKHNFYSRASREARLAGRCPRIYIQRFLLTRLSRGATTLIHVHPYIGQFLLTRLSRGATIAVFNVPKTETFLLTRLSRGATTAPPARAPFNSPFLLTRLSRGATPYHLTGSFDNSSFLLTRLSRGATVCGAVPKPIATISTHAPLARRDFNDSFLRNHSDIFLLTRLSRGATPNF